MSSTGVPTDDREGTGHEGVGGPPTPVDGAPQGRRSDSWVGADDVPAVLTAADEPVAGPAVGYRAPALERGLDVLELLALSGATMTQAEIGRALGRSSSELFRVLTVLERRGFLGRDPASGAYRPTLRLFELGQIHRPEEHLLRAAIAPMRALTAATRESCHLGALHRGLLLVLAQEEGPARVRLSVAVGSTLAPWQAASGRVLLAGLTGGERAALLAADPGWAALPGPDRVARLARLDLVAARGWEDASGETVAGVSDLSVAVGGGRVRAALALAALPRDHAAWLAASLPLLRQTAAAIAGAAGLLPVEPTRVAP